MTDQSPRTSRSPDEAPTRPLALTRDWRTARTDLDVLLVVHSLTAATRIADVLPALHDPRVQLHCVRTTGVFEAGIDDFVHHHGLHELTWDQAETGRFDLAVTASLGDDLHTISAPILRLPHGNGYNKYWNQEPGTRNQEPGTRNQEPGTRNQEPGTSARAFGLSDATLRHDGHLVPTAIALSHHEQFTRLREGAPAALPHAFLAGDPCHDRLLASEPHRLRYRQALGVRPHQELVTVNSTWREDSLHGVDPGLTARLLAELPHDHYRVALVLHPNVWSAHSPHQIRAWLDAPLRAGLHLVPPHEGWRAAVVAADHVLSDHGSVGMYAAALGKPVLLDHHGQETLDPRSGLGRVHEAAHRLDPHAPLVPQLHLAGKLRPHTHRIAADLVSSAPWYSLELVRAEAYRIMGAEPPDAPPALLAVPVPDPDDVGTPPASLWTAVDTHHEPDGTLTLSVHRAPASVVPQGVPGAVLVCDHRERDHRIAAQADAVTAPRDTLPADEGLWAQSVFQHRPGAQYTLAHAPERITVRPRGSEPVHLVLDPAQPMDHGLVAAVVAERHLDGAAGGVRALRDGTAPLRIRTGPEHTVTVGLTTEQ
ncbi:hypothetical protein IDM40_04605 [Nocardiopsis sp. HNM0947]|uniref:CDP-Glycerol:Poly(Glycerophosphate) glycerophosphotransferase n=1 Tax=Nocardiopsis coralli TaxID=2772213 RepID=A0ABR9P2D8_9ACTN|nr:hypothetical protein [Nocardiopsis coralli]MBE2997991.1 hypothetical protein [Nocardiopsis coralli]